MVLLDGHHKASYRDGIILSSTQLFRFVVHRVKFTNFVVVTDSFEERFNGGAGSWQLEVVFRHAKLSEGCWEEQVDRLGFITVVGIVCNRSLYLEWHIGPDSWAAKCSIDIFGLPHLIRTVSFQRLAKIFVGTELLMRGVT